VAERTAPSSPAGEFGLQIAFGLGRPYAKLGIQGRKDHAGIEATVSVAAMRP
jgi:hypothetical protein